MSAQGSRLALGVAAALVLTGSVVWIARGGGRGGAGIHSELSYYYDVKSGLLFKESASRIAPIDAPSGAGLGVRAVVVGCGGCDAVKLKALRLEKLSDEALAAMKDASSDPRKRADALTRGALVAQPPPEAAGEIVWHPQASGPGRAVLAADPQKLCGGEPAQFCSP